MLAKRVALIGRIDYKRVCELAGFFECLQHAANPFVDGHHALVYLLDPGVVFFAFAIGVEIRRVLGLGSHRGRPSPLASRIW